MTAPALLLQARGLRVYAGERVLVEGLDLDIRPGDFWCLIGPNGAGKTSLLHTLAGARLAAAGELQLSGRPLAQWRPGELACLRGLLPQQIHDAFATPVLDVVLQGRHPHLSRWHWEGQVDEATARAALAQVGLAGLERRDVRSLSGGERQRVALATLLTQDPGLLLLDEPLAHQDLAQQQRLLELLRGQARQRGRGLLMSVHDLSLAQQAASHVLLLGRTAQGQPLAFSGPVNQVMTEERLSLAFGHRLRRLQEPDGRVWWLP